MDAVRDGAVTRGGRALGGSGPEAKSGWSCAGLGLACIALLGVLETLAAHADRPLGEPGFIALGYRLFGLEPFGYSQLSLLAHGARAPIAFAIGRRLGVSRPLAAAAALLAVSRSPSLMLLWAAVGYASIAASLPTAVGVLCFAKALEGRGAAA
jgi:hypothetical protein